MDIPLNEAIELLREWQQDRRIIHAKFVDCPEINEFSCSIVGVIQELYKSDIRIYLSEDVELPLGAAYHCVVSFRGATFKLLDYRNTPAGEHALKEAVESAYENILTLQLPSGGTCELCTLKEGTKLVRLFRGENL
jgi:hypothetical protein